MHRHVFPFATVRAAVGRAASLQCVFLFAAAWSTGCEPGGIDGGEFVPSTPPAVQVQPSLEREMDRRKPKKAERTPPPIQGGSLLVLRDGSAAVVGDPDRDRIVVVSLEDASVRSLELPRGAEPGRAAEDDRGLVHVVLRGSGKLFTLDPHRVEKVRQRTVCKEPRGLAYESEDDTLYLACADGVLWEYDASSGEEVGQQFVYADLRDVALADQGALWLSTFRSAHVLRLEADGTLAAVEPLDRRGRGNVARAAWRLVSNPTGDAFVVHQSAAVHEIQIEPHKSATTAEEDADADAQDAGQLVPVLAPPGGSSYGGGGVGLEGAGCDSIVQSTVTIVSHTGQVLRGPSLGDAILPVDVGVTSDGSRIAVVSAGPRDPGAPKATFDFGTGVAVCDGCGLFAPVRSSVHILSPGADLGAGEDVCMPGGSISGIEAPAIAAAFVPDSSRLLVLTRDPSRLYVVDSSMATAEGLIELGGDAVTDTGHELFHRDSGGGIACASCHLEGTEDGHVWTFSGLGKRRTQPLNVRLRGTQPFHWDGDMDDLGPLMNEVFVGRMGGAPQSKARVEALGDWVFGLSPWKPQRAADDPAALRGQRLFESSKVGCASCHSGEKLTNNESVDVGTSDGVALQVPSLLGVGYRTPLMHTGCAATLKERFEPGCGGGDRHGQTSHLRATQIDDLIAYLQTL